jgi:asparaginyl-tRNA synthetase
LRHAVNYSIHSFFYEKGFTFINTPIITSLDTEGAGDSFRVTTLKNNEADFIKDFFGKESNLTVSGQLALESASLGLSEVYTFGPVFRAENSNTTRHLSEFWMLEVEMAFSNLKDVINLSESLIKYIINFVFENCRNDIHFLNKQDFDNKFKFRDSNFNILKMLEEILYSDFEILTYTNAIKILKNSKDNLNNNFNFIIKN